MGPIQIWILFASYCLCTIGFNMYVAVFAFFVIEKYGLGTMAVSYITLCMAVVFIFSLVFIFNALTPKLGLYKMWNLGLLTLGLSGLAVPFIMQSMWAVVV